MPVEKVGRGPWRPKKATADIKEEIKVATEGFRPIHPNPKQPPEEVEKAESIRHCYYRKPNGYITVSWGPECAQAQTKIAAGWEPLEEYSFTSEVRGDGSRLRIDYTADENKTAFYWFLMNGGAKEFTLEQILEHGWDVTPPYKMSRSAFPQLKDADIPERWHCRICDSKNVDYTPYREEAHLESHILVGHRYGKMGDPLKAIAEEIERERQARDKRSNAPVSALS